MERNNIYHMDALQFLQALPDASVNCIVTSPPYFRLRSYLSDGHPDKALEVGSEDTPQAFVARMVTLFREARRVLRDDGLCFVNLGDSYANDTKWGGATGGKHVTELHGQTSVGRGRKSTGLPPKSLMMIPARFAIAMQDDGWILRSEIVWAKKNPMPESVTDRPTKSHEMIYMFAKSERYYYDAEAVAEESVQSSGGGWSERYAKAQPAHGAMKLERPPTQLTRNLRDVWFLNTEPQQNEHYAAYPQKLIDTPIKAGCPVAVCSACGSPHYPVVERGGGTTGTSWHDHENDLNMGMSQVKHGGGVGNARDKNGAPYHRQFMGYQPSCECNAGVSSGVVCDFFMGSGTTALVARRLGRDYIGCDLNADYVTLARERLAQSDPFQHSTLPNGERQLSLFAALADDEDAARGKDAQI